MSESKLSQQERDAAFIAEMRESCRVIEKADRTYSHDEDYHIARDYFYANRNHLPFAALRTIDRQAAEIERLTAALAAAERERDVAIERATKAEEVVHKVVAAWDSYSASLSYYDMRSGEEIYSPDDKAIHEAFDDVAAAVKPYHLWKATPQPAARPVAATEDAGERVDARPSDEIIGVLDAISDAEHHHEDCAPAISQYEKLDGKTNLTLDALRALTLLVDSLEYDIRTLKAQKGETQS